MDTTTTAPITTTAQAEEICHTLGKPSKMPCYSYSTPASRCIVGMKMRKVANSVCSVCYACKGFYVFKSAKTALEKRFMSLTHPLWVMAMIFLIGKKEKSGFFRWHDSGDIQGTLHLEKLVEIANALPHIKFWLPTREYAMVSEYVQSGKVIPDNLIVRLSALMIDGQAPEKIAKRLGVVVSGVTKSEGFTCPSSMQGNKCLDCRACWDKNIFAINYKKH